MKTDLKYVAEELAYKVMNTYPEDLEEDYLVKEFLKILKAEL